MYTDESKGKFSTKKRVKMTNQRDNARKREREIASLREGGERETREGRETYVPAYSNSCIHLKTPWPNYVHG